MTLIQAFVRNWNYCYLTPIFFGNAMSEKNAKLISAAELRAHVARIVRATGSQEQEAQRVAHNLVMANLSGHDSHGVGTVPLYVRWAQLNWEDR